MSEEIARHYEYEYRNKFTDGAWKRARFQEPHPDSVRNADARLLEAVKGWCSGTEMRVVEIVTTAHPPLSAGE